MHIKKRNNNAYQKTTMHIKKTTMHITMHIKKTTMHINVTSMHIKKHNAHDQYKINVILKMFYLNEKLYVSLFPHLHACCVFVPHTNQTCACLNAPVFCSFSRKNPRKWRVVFHSWPRKCKFCGGSTYKSCAKCTVPLCVASQRAQKQGTDKKSATLSLK